MRSTTAMVGGLNPYIAFMTARLYSHQCQSQAMSTLFMVVSQIVSLGVSFPSELPHKVHRARVSAEQITIRYVSKPLAFTFFEPPSRKPTTFGVYMKCNDEHHK